MVSRKLLISTNIIALLLTGCAKYQCEATKTGVCASVEDTYEALYSSESSSPTTQEESHDTEKSYAVERSTTVIKPKPIMPLREPEKVYRIWIRDYEDENGYYVSNHFIYVSVGGKWVMKPVKKRTLGSVEDYDAKIKDYLIKKGKIKPPEEEDDEDDMDI